DDSLYPSISPSGEFITFSSSSWNLVYGDHNGEADVFLVRNPLFGETNNTPLAPTDLKQMNESDGAEIGVGRIINEGADESVDSVILSAKVEDSDGQRVALEVQIESVDEASGEWSSFEPIISEYVSSGEVATVNYDVPGGGIYTWRARTVDEAGKKSDWSHFRDNGIEADFISSNFSFVHITDVHLGSLTTVGSKLFGVEQYYESQSYPRFADVLYEIENLDSRPDFILIGGDNVEYDNEDWFRDFKSITEDFSKRTEIGIFFVPGNHDRYDSESSAIEWGETNLSGGNDNLFNYFEVMGGPEGVTSLFENDLSIMDAESSGVGGYNRYNYYFNHKGFQVIGLDSGEDTGVWDNMPEAEGINDDVFIKIETLLSVESDMPGIIFLHHPVYAEEKDPPTFYGIPKIQELTDSGEIAENGGIVHNWRSFINLCNNNNVQLILFGHNHADPIFDKDGNEINLYDWTEDMEYPLYIQTQSAGKDGDVSHGYRIVDVQNGQAIPREADTDVTKYEKIYSDLNAENDLEFIAYDSDGNKITADNNGKTTSFISPASEHTIIFEDTDSSRFEIRNNNSEDSSYDFILQKREEGAEIGHSLVPTSAYLIGNSEVCGEINPWCLGYVFVQKSDDYVSLKFANFEIEPGASHKIFVDWGNLSDFSISKTSFGIDGNFDSMVFKFEYYLEIDLNSPGELRVYDSAGNMTGMVEGEMLENIPNSIYIPESETVYIFGQSQEEITDGIRTQVVGFYDATYDLSIALSEGGEETSKFFADDILINNQTTHQFGIDWDALKNDEDGVIMEFDENGDGIFEKYINSDAILSTPVAILLEERYLAIEGDEIFFDASNSYDSDGNIILYEWDFDGDGIYEKNTFNPQIRYTYEDDFEDNIFLRVTDDEGLLNVASAEVVVENAVPELSDLKLYISETMDSFVLEGKMSDPGQLDSYVVSLDWGDGFVDEVEIEGSNVSMDNFIKKGKKYKKYKKTDKYLPDVSSGNIKFFHKYEEVDYYTVQIIVTDDDGGEASDEIFLESPKQIMQDALFDLKDIQTDDKNIGKKIDKAVENLEECLDDEYWQDDFHLDLLRAAEFFNKSEKAIKDIEEIIANRKKYMDFQNGQNIQEIIDKLSQSDVFLAKIIVYEAGGISTKDIKSIKGQINKILKL
ncbi:MAG: metallophosphoesterase, partial [Candidatus Pacebacteria bacterium]|nr:metallophosphoesterase [Candidatus Paceibacterota bacterium]